MIGSPLRDKFLNHVSESFFPFGDISCLGPHVDKDQLCQQPDSGVEANSWTGFGHYPIVVGNVRLKS